MTSSSAALRQAPGCAEPAPVGNGKLGEQPKGLLGVRRRLCARLWPRRLPSIEKINQAADFVRFVGNHEAAIVSGDRRQVWRVAYDRIDRPISYLEFGVYQGESIRFWSDTDHHPDSQFIGFDSFTGLPEHWNAVYAKGAFNVDGAVPEVPDHRVRFVKGYFQETLRPFLSGFTPRGTVVVNNDSDLYSSSLFTLTTLDHLLASGSILIFDEFADLQHEWRAFSDYVAAYGRRYAVIAATADFVHVAMQIL